MLFIIPVTRGKTIPWIFTSHNKQQDTVMHVKCVSCLSKSSYRDQTGGRQKALFSCGFLWVGHQREEFITQVYKHGHMRYIHSVRSYPSCSVVEIKNLVKGSEILQKKKEKREKEADGYRWTGCTELNKYDGVHWWSMSNHNHSHTLSAKIWPNLWDREKSYTCDVFKDLCLALCLITNVLIILTYLCPC